MKYQIVIYQFFQKYVVLFQWEFQLINFWHELDTFVLSVNLFEFERPPVKYKMLIFERRENYAVFFIIVFFIGMLVFGNLTFECRQFKVD